MCKRNLIAFMLILVTTFTLAGCGKDQALESFKEEMTEFCDNITNINAIDSSSETTTEDLLANLDKIESEFIALAEIEVPEQFIAIESLADEASAYMTEAVSLYHQAFESEEYDESYIALADESYQRAKKRVEYIGDILMGKIPDDENVEIYYEDDSTSGQSTPSQGAPAEESVETPSETMTNETEVTE